MTRALFTDLYELNMASSYLRRGMTEPATFSLFVRHLPPARGFLVAAGLEESLEFLQDFRFESSDLEYLGRHLGYDERTLAEFADVRFTGDVWAVPEGRIVFEGEPLLEVTAPIAEAQLVETVLLNLVTFDTTVASKAARCRLAAAGRELVDFSFRRTQGLDAAMSVARSSAIAGFVATSNVEAARRYGLRTAGTMAHSYIEAFPSEADAFRAFAEDFPDRTTFLVDTYDATEGVRTAIQVIKDLGLVDNLGIRLDSGDLGQLSREARRMLDDSGLPSVRIFASGGLDELDVDDLVRSGAPIDAFGVGTRMGVSADAPYLDTAYKLVEYAGRPVVKLSPQKVSAPGAKQVFRIQGAEGIRADVIGLRDEPAPEAAEPLLRQAMEGGRRTEPSAGDAGAIERARVAFEADLATLPEPSRDLRRPRPVKVRFSEPLQRLAERTR